MKQTYILIVSIETTKLRAGNISCLYFYEIKCGWWNMVANYVASIHKNVDQGNRRMKSKEKCEDNTSVQWQNMDQE